MKTQITTLETKDLETLLADTYAIYLQTQAVHWNIRGGFFKSIHDLAESHYLDLAKAIDEIAELISTHGVFIDASFEYYNSRMTIHLPQRYQAMQKDDMLGSLIINHQAIANNLKKWIKDFGARDMFAVEDVMVQRLVFHEKAIWMLKSSLDIER